ncbi:Nitrite reductase [NAD(P)H] [Methanosarcinaceae archaeon Ag5]|uniref:Nitrite reductase [NAD(P)H] n=1 Tax=Methanolapillus africanus TaxID=3028297 RepID=A0AAE4MHT3_9EURY|nr:Nitrite reductase [NAD(P)H] [Methanosarcinaceae archaeon Ag5]
MEKLTPEQITAAKSKGFLQNRNTTNFSGRIVVPGGVYTAEQLAQISECAKRFGNGKIAMTTRQSAEIVGIPYENIEPAREYINGLNSGIFFGGTGPKMRPISACKGTTCVFGGCDTQGIAQKLHQIYFVDRLGETFPAKVKIAVGGCPNNCVKPDLNDIGIVAKRQKGETKYQIYVGGIWGRKTRVGTPVSKLIEEEEILPMVDQILAWYAKNANPKERLGFLIERVGIEDLENALFSEK